MAQDFLDLLDTREIADERAGGFDTHLTDGDGRLLGEGRSLFDLLPADESARFLFCRHLAYANEFRLLRFCGVPVVAVCVGYASTRIVPVVVPRGPVAEELMLLDGGERLHPRLTMCGLDGAPLQNAVDLSHAHDLLTVLHHAFLFDEGGDTHPFAAEHVLSVRAAAMAKLFGCRMRIAAGGFGYAPLPTPDYGWCSGVLAALCHTARRVGAEQTVDLLFDKPDPDLALCHALIRLTDPGDPLPAFSAWNGPDVHGVFYVCHKLPAHPDVLHVAFSLSVREISKQGVRADPAYLPDAIARL